MSQYQRSLTGELTLPHIWGNEYEEIISGIGLAAHVKEDKDQMDSDYELAMEVIKKNADLFPYNEEELRVWQIL